MTAKIKKWGAGADGDPGFSGPGPNMSFKCKNPKLTKKGKKFAKALQKGAYSMGGEGLTMSKDPKEKIVEWKPDIKKEPKKDKPVETPKEIAHKLYETKLTQAGISLRPSAKKPESDKKYFQSQKLTKEEPKADVARQKYISGLKAKGYQEEHLHGLELPELRDTYQEEYKDVRIHTRVGDSKGQGYHTKQYKQVFGGKKPLGKCRLTKRGEAFVSAGSTCGFFRKKKMKKEGPSSVGIGWMTGAVGKSADAFAAAGWKKCPGCETHTIERLEEVMWPHGDKAELKPKKVCPSCATEAKKLGKSEGGHRCRGCDIPVKSNEAKYIKHPKDESKVGPLCSTCAKDLPGHPLELEEVISRKSDQSEYDLKKAFEDRWILVIGDEIQKIAGAHSLPYEFKTSSKGTQRDYIFKIGECEVVYSTMGADAKLNMRQPEKPVSEHLAIAKHLYNRLMQAHQPLAKSEWKSGDKAYLHPRLKLDAPGSGPEKKLVTVTGFHGESKKVRVEHPIHGALQVSQDDLIRPESMEKADESKVEWKTSRGKEVRHYEPGEKWSDTFDADHKDFSFADHASALDVYSKMYERQPQFSASRNHYGDLVMAHFQAAVDKGRKENKKSRLELSDTTINTLYKAKAGALHAEEDIVTPEEARKKYPHGLFATRHQKTVAEAEKQGKKVKVHVLNLPFGTYVHDMEIHHESEVKKSTVPPEGGWLKHFTEHYKGKSAQELHGARMDLHHTLKIWDKPENVGHPYLDKLLNERDAVLSEIQSRTPKLGATKKYCLTEKGEELKKAVKARRLYGKQYSQTWMEGLGAQSLRRHVRLMQRKQRGKGYRRPIKSLQARRLQETQRRIMGAKEEKKMVGKTQEGIPVAFRLTEKGKALSKAFGLAPQRSKLKGTPGVTRRGNINISARAGAGIARPPIAKIRMPAAVAPKMPKVTAPRISSPRFGKTKTKGVKKTKDLAPSGRTTGTGQDNFEA